MSKDDKPVDPVAVFAQTVAAEVVSITKKKKDAPAPEKVQRIFKFEWERDLLWTRDFQLKPCTTNIITIMNRHPSWHTVVQTPTDEGMVTQTESAVGFNEMTGRPCWINEPPFFYEAADPRFASGRFERGREVVDLDYERIADWFTRTYRTVVSADHCESAVKLVAQHTRFHPVQSFLTNLRWDGEKRLDTWLRHLLCAVPNVDIHGHDRLIAEERATRYLDRAGRYWAIQAVARAMDPGCMAHSLLVLEGPQGIYKSAALRALAMNEDWFFDGEIDISNKETFMSLRGKWIIEFAEFYALSKTDQRRVKHFITMPEDKYVEKYANSDVRHPRCYVLAATINRQLSGRGYLLDPTGNRRYSPVMCDPMKVSGQRCLDIEAIEATREQLWAEAYAAWAGHEECVRLREEEAKFLEPGEVQKSPSEEGGYCTTRQRCMNHRWWPTDEEQTLLFDPEQHARTDAHPWAVLCFTWAQEPERFMQREKGWTLTVLAETCVGLPRERMNSRVLGELGDALITDGWTVQRTREKGRTVERYICPKRNLDEVPSGG